MHLKTILTLTALLIAVPAFAVDICLRNVPVLDVTSIKHKCDKTKPDIVVVEVRDEDGNITTPGSITPDPCTNAEAIAFGESLLWAALSPVVNAYKRDKLNEAGIDHKYLRTLADDAGFTHAQKCARFDLDGFKAKYEAHSGVACP